MQESGGTRKVVVSVYDVVHSRVLGTVELAGDHSQLVDMEEQLYERVARLMHLENSEGSFRAGMRPTGTNQVYDRYLKAKYAEERRQDDPRELDTAIGLYQDALNLDRDFSPANLGLARCYLAQFRITQDAKILQKATAAAQRALQLDDDSSEAHTVLSEAYKSAKNKESSLAELNRAAESAPNSDAAYRDLGNGYSGNGQSKDAIAVCQRALSLNPYYWVNHAALGRVYYDLGDATRAQPEFQKITELCPDSSIGYADLGALHLRQGKWNEAIVQLQKALALAPDAETYSNLGTAYFFLKRYEEAVKAYEKAVQINGSQDEVLWGNLGDAYRWLGQPDKARGAYKKAIAIAQMESDNKSAYVLSDIGLLYGKMGEQAQAVHYTELAIAKSPKSIQLIYSEAQVYCLVGQPEKSIPALRKAFAGGYSREEAWNDPEFSKMQSLPEFVKLFKTGATK